jgi:hypothetical protein
MQSLSARHPCRESWARSRHSLQAVDEKRISSTKEKRGSFEGAIRIPLNASLFLFNDLAFLRIPRKSFRFPTLLFSIPTAPTKHSQAGLETSRPILEKRSRRILRVFLRFLKLLKWHPHFVDYADRSQAGLFSPGHQACVTCAAWGLPCFLETAHSKGF